MAHCNGQSPSTIAKALRALPGLLPGTYRYCNVPTKPMQGGFGDVYRCEDTVLHREVAIKVLGGKRESDAPPKCAYTYFRTEFVEEARRLGLLRSPRWVTGVHDVFFLRPSDTCEGIPCVVTDWIEGDTADKRLSAWNRPEDQILRFEAFMCIARGIGEIHAAGLIHRDLKFENILFDRTGSGDPTTLRIIDVGAAQVPHTKKPTRYGPCTPEYASPEALRADKETFSTDIFPLGVMMHEIFLGRHPFRHGKRPPNLGAAQLCLWALNNILNDPFNQEECASQCRERDLPGSLAHLLARLMATDPHQRIQSAQKALEEISLYSRQLRIRSRWDLAPQDAIPSGRGPWGWISADVPTGMWIRNEDRRMLICRVRIGMRKKGNGRKPFWSNSPYWRWCMALVDPNAAQSRCRLPRPPRGTDPSSPPQASYSQFRQDLPEGQISFCIGENRDDWFFLPMPDLFRRDMHADAIPKGFDAVLGRDVMDRVLVMQDTENTYFLLRDPHNAAVTSTSPTPDVPPLVGP